MGNEQSGLTEKEKLEAEIGQLKEVKESKEEKTVLLKRKQSKTSQVDKTVKRPKASGIKAVESVSIAGKDDINATVEIDNQLLIGFQPEPVTLLDTLKTIIPVPVSKKQGLLICEDKECSFSTSSKVALKKHFKEVHSKIVFTCDICSSCFDNILSFQNHQKELNHFKNFNCDKCDETFPSRTLLTEHRRNLGHELEKRFKCTFCDYAAAYPTNLESHIRTHTNEKPFKCDLCEASFSQNIALKHHKTSHERKAKLIERAYSKPTESTQFYSCTQCACKFTNPASLRGHVSAHSRKNAEVTVLAHNSLLTALSQTITLNKSA